VETTGLSRSCLKISKWISSGRFASWRSRRGTAWMLVHEGYRGRMISYHTSRGSERALTRQRKCLPRLHAFSLITVLLRRVVWRICERRRGLLEGCSAIFRIIIFRSVAWDNDACSRNKDLLRGGVWNSFQEFTRRADAQHIWQLEVVLPDWS
jgi:hypothetical protein